MTDVLAPVLIPYARFLEVRARRLDIVVELTQPTEALDKLQECVIAVEDDQADGHVVRGRRGIQFDSRYL